MTGAGPSPADGGASRLPAGWAGAPHSPARPAGRWGRAASLAGGGPPCGVPRPFAPAWLPGPRRDPRDVSALPRRRARRPAPPPLAHLAVLLAAGLAVLCLAACGGPAPSAAQAPPKLTLALLEPPVAFVGAASPQVTVLVETGPPNCYEPATYGLTILWNGHPLPTTPAPCGGTAIIPAADLAAPGPAQITAADSNTGATTNALTFYVLPAAQAHAGAYALVSAALGGGPDDGFNDSQRVAISATGRYVAFQSHADDLVPGPASGFADIYVRDTCIAAPAGCVPSTIRVSVSSSGALANGHSFDPSISADGRYVAFHSGANDLAPGVPPPSPAVQAVYLRDTCIGASGCTPQTILLSVTPSGTFANGDEPSLGADGRFVAMTGSPALVGLSGPTVAVVRDTCIGGPAGCAPQNYLASASDAGDPANLGLNYDAASPGGRYVSFQSEATNLVPGATNGMPHVFLRDTCLGATAPCTPSIQEADLNDAGVPANGNGSSNIDYPTVSQGGRYVAFDSAYNATNLGGAPTHDDLYLRDTCNNAPAGCIPSTTVISVPYAGQFSNSGSDNASITPDGRYVAFASLATNLVLGDPGPLNNYKDIFVRDTCLGAPSPCVPTTLWASIAQLPGDPYTPSYSDSDYPAISADGHYVAFISNSGTLLNAVDVTGGATAQVFIAKTGF